MRSTDTYPTPTPLPMLKSKGGKRGLKILLANGMLIGPEVSKSQSKATASDSVCSDSGDGAPALNEQSAPGSEKGGSKKRRLRDIYPHAYVGDSNSGGGYPSG